VTSSVGRYSSVGIATRYGLAGPGIESRWGARFSAPVQTDPEAHPAFCAIGAGRGVDHPPHLAPMLKKEYSYTASSSLGRQGLF
jgi:hypothetical protein